MLDADQVTEPRVGQWGVRHRGKSIAGRPSSDYASFSRTSWLTVEPSALPAT